MKIALLHVAGILAVPALLLLGIAAGSEWCKNLFRAGDKTVAAFFGWDGFHTVSAQCGASTRFLPQAVGSLIDLAFGEGHCEQAARKEGLLA